MAAAPVQVSLVLSAIGPGPLRSHRLNHDPRYRALRFARSANSSWLSFLAWRGQQFIALRENGIGSDYLGHAFVEQMDIGLKPREATSVEAPQYSILNMSGLVLDRDMLVAKLPPHAMQRRTPDEQREMQALFDTMHGRAKTEGEQLAQREARAGFLKEAPWIETEKVKDPLGGEDMNVNGYFAKRPEMVMGRLERSGKMRGKSEVNVKLDKPETLPSRAMSAGAASPIPSAIPPPTNSSWTGKSAANNSKRSQQGRNRRRGTLAAR